VPSPSNRRALIERGDADVSFDLPPKDASELAEEKRLTVVGTPIDNCIVYIDMNVKVPPFDKAKVRQAVAYARSGRGLLACLAATDPLCHRSR
jgi:peptide/nickel transport system substrate-binding protein